MRFRFLDFDREYLKNNRLPLLLLLAWLYRLTFMLQGNSGGTIVNGSVFFQLMLECGMLAFLISRHFNFLCFFKSNITRGFAFLYAFGVLSASWAFFPAMSGYFAFHNFILLGILIYLVQNITEYRILERYYIIFNIYLIFMYLFRAFIKGWGLHSVTYSTVSGMPLLYCFCELSRRGNNDCNAKWLKFGILIGLIGMTAASSSGAICSALAALLINAIVTLKGKLRFLCIVLLLTGGVMYHLGYAESMIKFIFPNKSGNMILTANGRTILWDMILSKAAERPWFGWGFASVERLIPDPAVDAHNAIIGTYGSLGYIGCAILIYAMMSQFLCVYSMRQFKGCSGLFAAVCFAFINSNTFNFLASREGITPMAFQALMALGFYLLASIRQKKYQELMRVS